MKVDSGQRKPQYTKDWDEAKSDEVKGLIGHSVDRKSNMQNKNWRSFMQMRAKEKREYTGNLYYLITCGNLSSNFNLKMINVFFSPFAKCCRPGLVPTETNQIAFSFALRDNEKASSMSQALDDQVHSHEERGGGRGMGHKNASGRDPLFDAIYRHAKMSNFGMYT